MHQNIVWRNGTTNDEEWMFALFKRTMQHYIESAFGWDELLQKESFITALPIKQFQILALDNNPIGAYTISAKPDHLVLDMILVEPEFQGQGWGKSLLNRVKTESLKLNKPVQLSVLKSNPAIDFHLKEGFERFDSDSHSIKMLWRG